jgi:MFS family permease
MAVCVGATLISMISFLPMYLQVVRGATPSQTGFLILPLTAGVAFGSLLTGRVIAITGRTALLPSIGLMVSASSLLFLGLFAHHLTTAQLPWVFALTSLSLGTAMPVVQTTVQMVAGPKMLGAAAASVQFSRSVGAALGTATVGAVLFAALSAIDPHTATMFADLVERGPTVLASQTADQAAVIQAEIAHAFRIAFSAVAVFAGCGAVLAWSIPVRRI